MCVRGALWVQTFRHEVRWLRTWDSSHAGGQEGAGQRLPLAVLRVRHVRETAQHRRRVLPHGGQETGLQARL